MPARRVRRPQARTLRGLRATAVAVAAVAVLTASQAPGLVPRADGGSGRRAADDTPPPPAAGTPYADLAPPDDGAYHTELPPLTRPEIPRGAGEITRIAGESGIPATVLRAYRAAESAVGRTDPGCRLPWELLAAIGKVESGHARGGAVDREGTTLGRITGPALDGRGFALIRDTDGGVHDGDPVYDRAVGPMQFLPSTWARWGVDGNGDGRADPDNVFDAALAAGHYLCAGDRDLGRAADLDRAILSYNYSRTYLNLVRQWLDFYRRGVHSVPDGEGVVPRSPGAGSDTRATEPVGDEGGGIVIGPDPSPSQAPSPSATATTGPAPSHSPEEPPTPDPSEDPSTTPDPTDSVSPSPDPGDPPPEPTCPAPAPTPSPTAPDTTENTPTCPPASPTM
ncbi:lytic transglycosylase domain-containing protein [Streptomyces shenzhenensis]|uniref:lytic transglycosylase domain-containing protein n=1 Tax=Streptomyces shenzhenensis TaxID=943815 RepID=UPI0037F27FB1